MPSAGIAERQFTSPCGTYWAVREVSDRGADGGRALIFDSGETWRRVRQYPADWRELDATALWALSWRR